jgi:hypothetical protein
MSSAKNNFRFTFFVSPLTLTHFTIMKELTIIDELKNMLPPLTDTEFTGLEESILTDGCLSPLIVWNNILVDGHHRYEICRKHRRPFSVKNVTFDSLDDAKLWHWQHQENRRNLTAFLRAEIALKFKPIIAAKAREHQRLAGMKMKGTNIPDTAISTMDEIGKLAAVSRNTVSKVEYLLNNADNATKNRLRNGDKGTSINREYCRLRSEIEPKVTETGKKMLPKETTIPKEWILWLHEDHPVDVIYGFIESFFAEYQLHFGEETVKHLLIKLCNKYIN